MRSGGGGSVTGYLRAVMTAAIKVTGYLTEIMTAAIKQQSLRAVMTADFKTQSLKAVMTAAVKRDWIFKSSNDCFNLRHIYLCYDREVFDNQQIVEISITNKKLEELMYGVYSRGYNQARKCILLMDH